MGTITERIPAPPGLTNMIAAVSAGCTGCGECLSECAFLGKHGTPRAIASSLDAADPRTLCTAFQCTLCGLCSEVCPERLDLDGLFLEMRRAAVELGVGEFPEHRPLVHYERLGTSRRFTLYRLPENCRTVFFPGCSLPGTRPAAVRRIFSALQASEPSIGIVFDCCMKPSRSLGREQYARTMFKEMNEWLVCHGVQEVLVACPNCQTMFEGLGQGLRVRTVWEALAESDIHLQPVAGTVTVHDPCVTRKNEAGHRAVRDLLSRQGLTVEEMPHFGRSTLCCGKGGAVDMLDPEGAAAWGAVRRDEAAGRRIVTYCAGCVQALERHTPTSHLADLLFEPERALSGRSKAAGAPLTYLNRFLLKRLFLKKGDYAVTRERTFIPEEGTRKNSLKSLILLVLLVAVVAGVHLSGGTQYLQQDRLQAAIASYGILAPAIYILLYSLAPVLFLPGLPITIVGGIVFGPFWGVVYTIVGSTIGASLAFLVARYAARDWVAARLTGPKWARLDNEVAQHGWKVVAFTRLIPAFPFNLLNYAFGLTTVPFLHYVTATFVCMLPACIAFIVFSSSLLGLFRGSVSPTALLGVLLVVLVSLIPVIYRRFKRSDPMAVAD